MAANPGKDSSVDPDSTTVEDKNTLLRKSAKKGQLDKLRHLINEKHCDPVYTDERGWTVMHYAARKGHLEIIQFLCDECAIDPKLYEQKNCTNPLHLAARKGHLNVLTYLIKKKHCSPMCRDEDGFEVLDVAIYFGHLNIVQYLIEECDVDLQTYYGESTPLHLASEEGQLEIMRYFIKERHCDPMCKDEDGQTSLHLAALHGHLQVVQYLIDECGVDPECRDDNEQTPLHCATQKKKLKILVYLIKQKHCDPMCRDKSGCTILHLATSGDYLLQIASCLIDECGVDLRLCWNETIKLMSMPIYDIIVNNQWIRILRFFIKEKDCDPMYTELNNGWTILHLATNYGYLSVVRFLINECAMDPKSCMDNSGRTVLYVAAQKGHTHILKYLINEKKCDPTHRDSNGWTILDSLSIFFYSDFLPVLKCLIDECNMDPDTCWEKIRHRSGLLFLINESTVVGAVRYLIKEKHCGVMCRDKDGQTILHKAASEGLLQVVQCLINECGVDPMSCMDDKGQTPLHVAAIEGEESVVKYLIKEKHCDPMCRGAGGMTALHLAAYGGHLQSVKYLIDECGVDPKSCLNDEGETPLHCAAQQKKLNVVKYLIKEKQCDPTLEDNSSKTALQTSDYFGHLEYVQYLIEQCGVDPKSLQAQLEKFNSIVNEYLKSKGVEKTDVTTTQEEGKLEPSDLHQISSYLHDLPYESLLLLGLALGLSYTKLRRQEKATFLLEMLSMWLREEDNAIEFGPPTWSTLVKALRDKTVSQNGIAQTIEKNHCK